MKFEEGNIYHIYNRGIDRRAIFFRRSNYLFFMRKMRDHICRTSDLLAWVLMPNHFHFLLHANEDTCRLLRLNPLPISACSDGIRLLLSSYAKAIQKQERLTGNLFQQKTKAKLVSDLDRDYSSVAFHYIHQNPFRAGLVDRIDDWEFSSIHEYTPLRRLFSNGKNMCNVKLAHELLDLGTRDIREQAYCVIPTSTTENIFHRHHRERSTLP